MHCFYEYISVVFEVPVKSLNSMYLHCAVVLLILLVVYNSMLLLVILLSNF